MGIAEMASLLKDLIYFAEEALDYLRKEHRDLVQSHCEEAAYSIDLDGNEHYYLFIRSSQPSLNSLVEDYLATQYSLSDVIVFCV